MKSLIFSFLLVVITISGFNSVEAAVGGCVDDASCTDVCAGAGAGQCVDGKYCICANCPQRSPSEAVNLPQVCTLEPSCQSNCPASSVSVTNGKIYTGHQCAHLRVGLICICYCMPTTVQSVIDVAKCPFPKKNSTSTSSPIG